MLPWDKSKHSVSVVELFNNAAYLRGLLDPATKVLGHLQVLGFIASLYLHPMMAVLIVCTINLSCPAWVLRPTCAGSKFQPSAGPLTKKAPPPGEASPHAGVSVESVH